MVLRSPSATCLSWVGPPSDLGGGFARAVLLLVSQSSAQRYRPGPGECWGVESPGFQPAGDGTRQVPPKFNFAIIRARYSSLGPFSPYRETSSKIMQITIFVSRVSSSIEATGAVLDESDGEGEDVESWNTWDKGHFCSGCSHSDYAHASCGATPHCMARLAFL